MCTSQYGHMKFKNPTLLHSISVRTFEVPASAVVGILLPPRKIRRSYPSAWTSDNFHIKESYAHIGSIITNQLGYWPNIPHLCHTQDCSNPSHQKCHQRRRPNRQLLLPIPHLPIIPFPSPKDQVFLQRDRNPDRDPIAHKRQEVREYLAQIISSRKGTNRVYHHTNRVPNKPRNFLRLPAQNLKINTRTVRRWDDVCDET